MVDPQISHGWWDQAFSAEYVDVYAHRDDAQADCEVAGLLPRLMHAPGPILDACCGNGRHLAALRAAGLTAIGFDLSQPLLAQARTRSTCQGRLTRADMRQPGFAQGFGAVLLLFTAFGYFTDDENARTFSGFAQLLAPGGWLVLDLPDAHALRAGLAPDSTRCTPGGLQISEQRRLLGNHITKDVQISRAGVEVRRYTESVRLYDETDLRELAQQSGLQIHDRWPSLRGADVSEARHVYWLRK